MAKKSDHKIVKSGPLAGMFGVSSISRWTGDGMALLRNWVQYGNTAADEGDNSADKKSLSSSASWREVKGEEYEDGLKARKNEPFHGHDLKLPDIVSEPGRTRGRRMGLILDPMDDGRLDRLEELWDDPTVASFASAVRRVIEEEDPYDYNIGSHTRRLRVLWAKRHPQKTDWRKRFQS